MNTSFNEKFRRQIPFTPSGILSHPEIKLGSSLQKIILFSYLNKIIFLVCIKLDPEPVEGFSASSL